VAAPGGVMNMPVTNAVAAAETRLGSTRALRESLESQQRLSKNLDREYKYGYNYLRAVEADLREMRIRIQEEEERWKKAHPLRTAASSVLGEPDYLREMRERSERAQQEQRETREQRK